VFKENDLVLHRVEYVHSINGKTYQDKTLLNARLIRLIGSQADIKFRNGIIKRVALTSLIKGEENNVRSN